MKKFKLQEYRIFKFPWLWTILVNLEKPAKWAGIFSSNKTAPLNEIDREKSVIKKELANVSEFLQEEL